jgi:hypothetical protein
MKAAKVSDYRSYARELVEAVPDQHISFEVFSDDIGEMVAQARDERVRAKRLREAAGDDDARRAAFQCRSPLSHDGIK